MSLLSRMAFWKRPSDEVAEQMALARLLQELIVHPTPFMSQGGSQPNPTSLLNSVTGAPAIATRVIADRISGLEFQVVATRTVRKGTTEDEVLDDHPLKILLDHPSDWFSSRQIKRLIAQHTVTIGQAYLGKIMRGSIIPQALQPLPPDRIEPVGNGYRVDGYTMTSGVGGVENLAFDEVIRIWNPDPEALFASRGTLGPQARLANMLEYSEEHLRSFYETDATPQVVFEATDAAAEPMTDEGILNRFTKKWLQANHSRLGTKRGIPPFIAPGWHANILDAARTLTGTKELMEYARDAIMMAYGVPRSIAGDIVDANRAAAETNAYVFDVHTILPLSLAITDAFTRDLASMYPQNPGVKLSVRFKDFVAQDKAFRLEEETADLVGKVRNINQVRSDRDGLDPVSWGEDPVATIGQVPYDPEGFFELEDDMASAFEDDPERSRSSHRAQSFFTPDAEWKRQIQREKKYVPTFLRAMRTIFRDQLKLVLAKLDEFDDTPRARAIDANLLIDPEEWGRLFEVRVDPIREKAFEAIALETVAGLGGEEGTFIFTDSMRKVLREQGARLVQQVNTTTGKRLSRAVSEFQAQEIAAQIEAGTVVGEGAIPIAKRIERVFAVRNKEARTIARTEILKASQAAQLESYEVMEVEQKQWNTMRDAAVRDHHAEAEGQIVNRGEAFFVGGEMASAPGIGVGGGGLSPGNSINCRCFLTPVRAQ